MTAQAATLAPVPVAELPDLVRVRIAAGERFAGLFASAATDPADPSDPQREDTPGVILTAVMATSAGFDLIDARVGDTYPALTATVPAAFWYERAIHDLYGIRPIGHPRLDPLILPLADPAAASPRPGRPPAPAGSVPVLTPDERAVPRHVHGPGVFAIPHGPVRSGVMESIEYVVETAGEDIPHLQIRVFAKHRGVERRFDGLPVTDGVLLAERVEGVASVAHALAYCHAVETLAGVSVPAVAGLVRVLHAELERVAGHLDVVFRLADAAGLAVATARFGWHKERLMRLRDTLCGNRFGRGVVLPGGVAAQAMPDPDAWNDLRSSATVQSTSIRADLDLLLRTPSFLDRVRTTGPLDPDLARGHGALGPIGRASGFADDCRATRPYDAYPRLDLRSATRPAGDALARLQVRVEEIEESFGLILAVAAELATSPSGDSAVPVPPVSGRAIGWAEAPQGEVLYLVEAVDGRLVRCAPRSASFHNLMLFHRIFTGDILTDFPFNEASFGLSVAGVVM